LVPETETLVTLKDALPVLVKVTDWAAPAAPTAWLANASEVVERLAAQAAAVPVPEKFTFCSLVLALSVIVKVAVREPLADGLKMTWTEHVAPAASDLPQVVV
jgi:hypothetical protein